MFGAQLEERSKSLDEIFAEWNFIERFLILNETYKQGLAKKNC
jgi:hypothetical protein